MSFARPEPVATFTIGGVDVWADRATPPNGSAASASTNARRAGSTLIMQTSEGARFTMKIPCWLSSAGRVKAAPRA